MDRASRAIRRSGARLKALNGGHADLNLVISELRDVRLAMKSFLTAQNAVAQDMVLWAQADEDRVIQDVMAQLAELNALWTDVQKDFVEQVKSFRQHFELILEGEKQVDQARTALAACEQKELRIRKELKRAAKKATVEEMSQLEVKLAQAERAKDLAQFETLEKVQEHEAVKLIRLKQGLVQLSEAYLALANRGALLFEAQRDVARAMPDSPPHHCSKYTGSGAMKQAVQRAKDRVEKYHCYQYRLIPHCPSVEEPPPPYTPGYYDPRTGQPYQEEGWGGAAPPAVRQRVAAPSCPAVVPSSVGGDGVRGRPLAAPPLPAGRPRLLLPPPEQGAAIWPWGPEDEERLAGAMGAARIG